MIFKNINSEDISGLIICSEPPISSSAIRTKETTIDGRDGAIVEKLGYKTRIRNVEIGLKKDANVDKILSYFSGEGDLIFKNENDKVYKAAIYEQVDLERLLRLRKGSVAFYCQPFKYKRNDIFETIKDNKVKEKKGEYLELLNCAEQNVVDLKLEGSTSQVTRSGKNKLPYNYYDGNSKTVNGITFTVNKDRSITANGTATANASFSITNLNNYAIVAGSYKLVGENSEYTKQAIRGSYKKTDGTTKYVSSVSDFIIEEGSTNVYFYIVILQGETVNNVTFYPMLLNSTETDLTFEAGGASPSPDYPAKIENVEGNVEIKDIGENLFDKKNNTILTWLTAAEITEEGSVCSKNFIPTTKNKIYATNFSACVFYYDKKLNYLGNSTNLTTGAGNLYTTWTNPDNNSIAFMKVEYRKIFNNNLDMTTQEIMLTESGIVKPYKPYQEQKLDFPLSEGQKLYEGSYLASDGIHHKRKQTTVTIQKIVALSNGNVGGIFQFAGKKYNNNKVLCCDKAKYDPNRRFVTDTVYENQENVVFVGDSTDTLETLKARYDGAILEYELATEEIVTYTTAQQEAYNQLQKLKLYKGQNTMFSLEGSIINLKYLEDTDEKVENQGNIYSKPIIRLEKTVFKEVEIAINGIRFKYNFEEDDYVEIDCEEMTVQYEGLNRNRRLVIDFEFPKLKEGNNDIIMYDGDCIIKCKRKDRWL